MDRTVTADRDLQRAVDRLCDTMAEYAFAKVRQALDIERDRTDREIAELHRRVDATTTALRMLNREVTGFEADALRRVASE